MKHQKVSVNETCSTFNNHTTCYQIIGKAQTQTRADMQYEPVDTHGQQQNIELQSNAAYASWVK